MEKSFLFVCPSPINGGEATTPLPSKSATIPTEEMSTQDLVIIRHYKPETPSVVQKVITSATGLNH